MVKLLMVSFTKNYEVPKDAEKGDTIHVVVEVQDNGKHQLKHCQRVIITVKWFYSSYIIYIAAFC